MTEQKLKSMVGKRVFVQLGYVTVKCGQIYGYRVTRITDKDEIDYYVHWFGNDRGSDEEWFASRYVHETPNGAFDYNE